MGDTVPCGPCLSGAHSLCADAQGSCRCSVLSHKVFEVEDETTARLWLQALERHYGEPVMPISRYCDALGIWADVVSRNATSALAKAARAFPAIHLAIRKSNLLARLLYDGQQLRSMPCPEHDGRWSGCFDHCPHGCTDNENVTGWLPNAGDYRALASQNLRRPEDDVEAQRNGRTD